MPIDASIPMSYRPPQIDPVGAFSRAVGIRQTAEGNELALEGAGRQNELQKALYADQMMARAAQMGADSPEAWDQAFTELSQQVPQAQQYIGKWSPMAAQQLSEKIGAAPGQAAAAQRGRGITGDAGGGGIGGGGPSAAGQPQGARVDLSSLDTPAKRAEEFAKLTMGMEALSKVSDLQSFEAAIEQLAPKMPGVMQFKGKFNDITFGPWAKQFSAQLQDQYRQLAGLVMADASGAPVREAQPGYDVQYTEAGPVVATTPVGGGAPSFEFAPVGGDPRKEFLPPPSAGGGGGGKPPSGYTWGPAGEDGQSTLVPIPGGPADKTGKRPLTQNATKELSTLGDQFAVVQKASSTFKSEFASQGIAGRGGETALWAGRNLGIGASQTAVDWWQAYDRYKNVVRNELFGAALTPSEEANFEKTDINANMTDETIRANLRTQKSILEDAIKRRQRSLVTQGYNAEAVEQLTGMTPDQDAPPDPNQPTKFADMDPQPLPADRKALVVWTEENPVVYQTAKGPARYRGNGRFELVQ